MMHKRISLTLSFRALCPWSIATFLCLLPAGALGQRTDDECGAAESCAAMSPSPASPSSTAVRGRARGRQSSVEAANRKASSQKTASKKASLSARTLVATDASVAPVPTGESGRPHGRTK